MEKLYFILHSGLKSDPYLTYCIVNSSFNAGKGLLLHIKTGQKPMNKVWCCDIDPILILIFFQYLLMIRRGQNIANGKAWVDCMKAVALDLKKVRDVFVPVLCHDVKITTWSQVELNCHTGPAPSLTFSDQSPLP